MYSVNGVPLHNSTYGWILRAPSKPLSELESESRSFRVAGLDGVVKGQAADVLPPAIAIVVNTPQQHLETLYALVRPGGKLSRTGVAGREVEFEHLTTSIKEYSSATERWADVTFMLRLTGAFWRTSTDQTTPQAVIDSAIVNHDIFSGVSAPMRDVTVRVKGPVSGLRVTDEGSGSWFTYSGSLGTGQAIMFTDGFAAITTFPDSNWDDYDTDGSGFVDFNGPRGVFELTPYMPDPLQPQTRVVRLRVTTTSRGTGARVWARGKAAYLV